MPYEAVIGLEIHAQLRTASKIFCGCSTRFGAAPNSQVCPVCLGLPGALPVLNARAVDHAVRIALALGCQVHPASVFARKHYFYPDLPKGYQITQYDQPLASGGVFEYGEAGSRQVVRIRRVHLEEDAGKSLHDAWPGPAGRTGLDFNRSGVPLVEIVTEPDLGSGAAAARFFEQLRGALVALGVSDGNLEEGNLRADANVSVRASGAPTLGTKTEVKNLNSFRFLRRALDFEVARHVRQLEAGAAVRHETRLWDAGGARTVVMRTKEEASDYRYFPDPDLPPLVLDAARVARLAASLSELPAARAARYVAQFGLPEAEAALLAEAAPIGRYFEAVARESGYPRTAAYWVTGELIRAMKARNQTIADVAVAPHALAGLIRLVEGGAISGPTAKAVFEQMWESGRPAEDLVREQGLAQISDEAALAVLVRRVLAENPRAVAQYKGGRALAFGFFVGQVMKATGGKANPAVVSSLLRRELDGPV